MRASSRPKNSSTNLRATCVESTRSAGAWKEPTFSAREWRSATEPALGAHGSCTWTKSSGAIVSTSSIVRAMSTGGAGLIAARGCRRTAARRRRARARRRRGRTAPPAAPARPGSACRDSRTSSGERDGASNSTRCPRSASSRETSAANVPTSFASSNGCGATWAMAKRSGTSRSITEAALRPSRTRCAAADPREPDGGHQVQRRDRELRQHLGSRRDLPQHPRRRPRTLVVRPPCGAASQIDIASESAARRQLSIDGALNRVAERPGAARRRIAEHAVAVVARRLPPEQAANDRSRRASTNPAAARGRASPRRRRVEPRHAVALTIPRIRVTSAGGPWSGGRSPRSTCRWRRRARRGRIDTVDERERRIGRPDAPRCTSISVPSGRTARACEVSPWHRSRACAVPKT